MTKQTLWTRRVKGKNLTALAKCYACRAKDRRVSKEALARNSALGLLGFKGFKWSSLGTDRHTCYAIFAAPGYEVYPAGYIQHSRSGGFVWEAWSAPLQKYCETIWGSKYEAMAWTEARFIESVLGD